MRPTIGAVVCVKGNYESIGLVESLTVTENAVIIPIIGNIGTRLPIDELTVLVESPRWDFTYGDTVGINAPWLAGGVFTVVGVSASMITVESHDRLTFNYARECVYRL